MPWRRLARALVHWYLPQTTAPMMLMLGKELLSGLWVCPECRSFAVFFTLDHVSPSCFTVLSFLTTFVATRRCRCLLQSVRVNVMPGRLLIVISGILAGGIPGFCIELCWFLHPLIWPLVCSLCFLFCFLFGAIFVMTHKMSSCMNPYRWLQSHFLVFFWLVCFWLVCCCFWVLFCVFGFLAVIAYWTAYRSITSTFGAIDYWQPCTIISIHLLIRSNVSNDLAEAMKALDGKKDSCTVTAQWIMCRSISVLLYHIVIITSCPIGTACPYWNRTSCAAPHGQINCPAGHCARWRNWKRVGHRSWRRGQTAVGGSIPRWSASKPQVVTRQKAKGTRQKKKWRSWKRARNLRGFPEVPPLLLLPRTKIRKSTAPTYRTLLTRMSFKSTRTLINAEDRQSTRDSEWPWAPVVSLSFHLRSVFTPRSLVSISTFYIPYYSGIAGFWIVSHVSVRMLPVRLALCDLETPGWGEPWFPHCAVA